MSDTDEIRLGADPLQSATVPTESFEVVVPGTAVGLGAWDLIGIFGGGPVFVWILFGFLTRRGSNGAIRGAPTHGVLQRGAGGRLPPIGNMR